MLLHPKGAFALLLLPLVASITADGNEKNHTDSPLILTAPAELSRGSSERFSRLLKDSANVLQFSSISNAAPPIWGIQDSGKKSKVSKTNSITSSSFGRRALDYDESHGLEEQASSESKNIRTSFPPGHEILYAKRDKSGENLDSDISASVTSINNKPPRVPLALLRQKKGKRVNISPLFTEIPQVQHADAALAKEFVWVDQPAEQVVGVNRQGRKQQEIDDATTNPAFQEEEVVEATTLPVDIPVETTTSKQNKSKMIVNIVTSAPRFSVESSVGEKKVNKPSSRFRTKTTTTTSTTTSTSTSASVIPEATTPSTTTSAQPTTSTTTTTEAPPTTVSPPVLSSSSPKTTADVKENLVADTFQREGTSYRGFEDSQTKLQTAESSQPARVNVRPAQNGKEYEYEYIYYYYDDDDDNSTEKHAGEPGAKAVVQSQDIKQTSSTSTTLTPSSGVAAAPASSSTTVTASASRTTSRPHVTSDADFEYEDDAIDDDEVQVSQQAPEIRKSTPIITRTTSRPIHKAASSAEKLSNSNPINQLDRSRGPKILSSEKFDDAVADYKLETEASQEDEVIETNVRSKGQPQRLSSTSDDEEDEETANAPEVSREPSTLPPGAGGTVPGFDISHMSTLAKAHKDSVNSPLILKQSNLLKAVPVSQLQPHNAEISAEQPSTVPFTSSPTTATTEAPSTPGRASLPRFRGNGRLRGNITPRPATATSAVAPEAEEKPQQSLRRPNLRDSSSRRIPSRRPAQDENIPEPAASPVIENQARPLPIRPRFPPRVSSHSTSTTTTSDDEVVSEIPATSVTVSAAELNSLEDKKAKDNHVRAKSANDLYAFTRLQQAISSRAPSRIPPKLVAGFVNSAEVTTDAMSSSEVTTVSSFGGQSSETVVSDESPSTTTTSTTTSTTTEAVQLDKFGRQRTRFGGRARRPLGGASASSTTTAAPANATPRGRFTGRRRTSTTEGPEGTAAVQQSSASASTTNSEAPKPRIPSRNRFASRNRGFSASTESSSASTEGVKSPAPEGEKQSSVAPAAPRRRPGSFQGRRRNPNQSQSSTESTSASAQDETASSATNDVIPSSSTAAPSTPGRNRFNFGAGARPRPGGSGTNPLRIRGGGRLRGPTSSTTTEAAPEANEAENTAQEQPADAEQSPTIQNEHTEQVVQAPASESAAPARGSGGVLGRLKNRPKLVVTTTTASPESGNSDRRPSRLNGILNRRKNLGQLAAAVHVKEEVRETTSEVAEEASNHAQEQVDSEHKGVVVQISSSVTESEEVNEATAAEEPATTPGSILNRLKSQRKPGSLFRKKPDPHGE